ncbi:alkane 1-monooxygenase [Boseongicola aestuarii]|uniref:Alkane 1-monooxygenase n=1 Tax=Boseongicola aestuarii TaxID=1470561 RepID=A0A238IXY4_9RHOB|nr:alkane 1-monooxygenase [Boseongicola aestuarii]SMX23246.1 Alkane 1-monooxygenase [Boseongicola aestuarii]
MTQSHAPHNVPAALPFWVSLTLVPIAWTGAVAGGWTLALLPLYAWVAFSVLDQLLGLDLRNPNVATPKDALFWHRLITLIWPFVQVFTTFSLLAYATFSDHLSSLEKVCLFLGVGLMNGTIGLVYAHELIHKPSRFERFLGDLLLGMVLYGHYRSEHLLVHHKYVGTPRDPVTARFREHFWRFYPRVLYQSLVSSFLAERALLARKGRPYWHLSNPFWRYVGLALSCLSLAFAIGGIAGLALFMTSAGFAIFQLELVNYIEHYGLTRRYLGDGRYEPQKLHHSWNSAHATTSALLINVTRHSDHHASPTRPYPLLQTPNENAAPHLPYGYAIMTTMALVPPLWMRRMNPLVKAWRQRFYPDITDWTAYDKGKKPSPR